MIIMIIMIIIIINISIANYTHENKQQVYL